MNAKAQLERHQEATLVPKVRTCSNFVPIGASGYYGAQLSVTNDTSGATTHTVTNSQPIWVQAYGFGPADAYAYFGGLVK